MNFFVMRQSILLGGLFLFFLPCYAGKLRKSAIQEVESFLQPVDVSKDEKRKIISHFKHSAHGLPVCRSLAQNIQPPTLLRRCEELIFAYPLSRLKSELKKELLRINNMYSLDKISLPNKRDKHSEGIVKRLIKRSGLPKATVISVYRECNNRLYDNPGGACFVYNDDTMLYPIIYINPYLSKSVKADVGHEWLLAHELAHIERGSWTCYQNILIAKCFLGISFWCITHQIEGSSDIMLPYIFGFLGIIMGNYLKAYFQRLEEKACDLRAVDYCRSSRGVKQHFSRESEYTEVAVKDDWEILEMCVSRDGKIDSTPEQFFKSDHPAHLERIRYCNEYAKKRGYPCDAH